MADYSQKQGKRRDDNGLGTLVDFLLANARVILGVSGAAVLALATLAVKRLIDRATSNPDDDDDIKAKQKSLEESWQEISLLKAAPKVRRKDLEEPLLTPVTLQEPKGSAQSLEDPVVEPKNLLCFTLQEKLLSFHESCVCISEAEKALGQQLAESIAAEFQNFLKSKHPELPFGDGFLSGYLCDGLIDRERLEVVLVLPLVLESHLWHLVPGEQTVVNDPWFGMIKRTGLEYFSRGNSPWDRFLVGGYLSSNTLSEVLHKMMVTSVNWPVIGSVLECVIQPEMASKVLKLAVRHGQISLDLTLCPTVRAEGKILVATSFEDRVENLWQQDFYAAEVLKLKDLDARDGGIRQSCANILKVICESHPFWSKLASRPLTHTILHLSKLETEWSEDTLSDRCRQVLEELVQYLEQGSLPCFFDSRINVLGQLSLEEIEEIGYTLYEALAEPDLAMGLCL